MARMPGAIWKPVSWANRAVQARPSKINVLIFHVAVSEAASLQNYFEGTFAAGNPVCSHLYVRRDGTIEQYIDTKYLSVADVFGNHRSISVETQGGVNSPDSEKWTASQVKALAKIAEWAHKTHGIPLSMVPDSKPSTAGIGWHRRGVKGNYGTEGNKYAYVAGEEWARDARICPGLGKIKQIPEVVSLAKKGGGSSPEPKPDPKPNPKRTTKGKTDEQLAREIEAGIWGVNPERRNALGDRYTGAQAWTNYLFYGGPKPGGGASKPANPGNNEAYWKGIADRVYKGEFKNNPERRTRLKQAGIDPDLAQAWTNYYYYNGAKPSGGGPAPKPKLKSVQTIANEIVKGDSTGRNPWGNEPERSKKLRAEGYTDAQIKQIQAAVNRMV